jgi:protein-disulfide isomerase
LIFLVLAALAATILVGCGGSGSGGSAEGSEKQQATETAGSSGQKTELPEQEAEGTDPSGRAAEKQPGHPALGSADAPVVLTEYSDYQ